MTADLIAGVRCIVCGSGQIMAVKPGTGARTLDSPLGPITISSGTPDAAWCFEHWPSRPKPTPAGETK